MRLTTRELNRATLARQLLLEREPLDVLDGIRRVVALQAQEPASPYIALWNRLAPFDPTDLDAAFAGQAIVKASLMRITLHAVHATDYAAFHEAMQPTLRAARLGDPRFRVAGLTIAQADALIPEMLAFAHQPRTNADMETWLDERLGVLPKPGVWWAMRTFAPFVHAPVGGPWSFGPRPAYVAARDQRRLGDPEAALPYLVHRYLDGFGPASVADIAQFAMVPRARIRAAIAALGGELVQHDGPDATPLFDVPGGVLPPGDSPAPPRLLPMWDSILLAHADRSRIVPPAYRKVIARSNGDTLPTLLVDGHVAGVWRPSDGAIEATAFHRLSEDAWAGLATEARGLVALLAGRDPTAYGRYARWWQRLPAAEVRLLPG